VPALLLISEAAWVAVLLAAAAGSGTKGVHTGVAWPALALPAVAALAWYGLIWRRGRPWWVRVPVVAAGTTAGAVITAAVIASSTGLVPWSTAFRPWTSEGHPAAVAAGVAWTTALLAWSRGSWLAAKPPSFRHAAWSVGLGSVAFLAVFAGRLDHHAPGFVAETGNVGWSLLLFFPIAGTALALVRERDLEEEVLARTPTTPGLAWLTVLALPLFAVALVAVGAGLFLGTGGSAAWRGISRAAGAVGGGIESAARWLWGLWNGGHTRRPTSPRTLPATGGPGRGHAIHPAFTVPTAVWLALALVVSAAVVWWLIRNVSTITRWRAPQATEETAAEERSSTFSWRHLMAHLAAWIARFRGALRKHRRAGPSLQTPPEDRAVEDDLGLPQVRAAYRTVLAAARLAGLGRHESETADEFESRVAPALTAPAGGALRTLTSSYDATRYGEKTASADVETSAVSDAAIVRASLEQSADPAPVR
jgi:hypothetical protein